MLQPYPESEPSKVDLDAEAEIDWMMQFVLGVRKIKGEMNVAPGKRVPVLLANMSTTDRKMLEINRRYIEFIGKLDSVEILSGDDDKPESAMTLLGEMNILIPLEGLIDKKAEISRLSNALKKSETEIERLEIKISNPGFVGKAPAQVVEKEQQKLADCFRAKEELSAQIKQLTD
jgi:valyl-tRNA synthetase